MNRLTSIVAISKNGAIGCNNNLPWKLKSDLKFFREQTTNNVVIMGRMTHDSIGHCLPNRHNIILSHNAVLFPSTDECKITLSIEETLFAASKFPNKEIFVVGGASTYLQLAPYVDRYIVTIVDIDVPEADAFLDSSVMSEITDLSNWDRELIKTGEENPGIDEAPFEIYELVAGDAEARQVLRAKVIEEFSQKAQKPKKPKKRNAPQKLTETRAPEPLSLGI